MTKGILLSPKVTNMTSEKLLEKMRFISAIFISIFLCYWYVREDICIKKKNCGYNTSVYKYNESHVLLEFWIHVNLNAKIIC